MNERKSLCQKKVPGDWLGEMNWSEVTQWKYFLVFPIGFLFSILLGLIRLWSKEGKVKVGDLPSDAIIYAFHPEIYLFASCPSFWNSVLPRMMGLGNHTFISYLAGVSTLWWKMKILRYQRRGSKSARQQIIEPCHKNPDLFFGIRTDSGGPYFKVRESLLDIALETKRPLVALRQKTDRALVLKEHSFALPGATVDLTTSDPIFYEEIKNLSRANALKLIQDRIENCQ